MTIGQCVNLHVGASVLALTLLYSVIASLPDGSQGAERRSNLNGEIATLPSVARNDRMRKVIYETVH